MIKIIDKDRFYIKEDGFEGVLDSDGLVLYLNSKSIEDEGSNGELL